MKVLLIILLLALSACTSAGKYDEFAKCLTEKDVKMYGAYWCSHCQAQKKLFGSSWQYVNYVECSLPGGQAQTEYCKTQGVSGYPTWEFGDKTRLEGEATFEDLAARSGCALLN